MEISVKLAFVMLASPMCLLNCAAPSNADATIDCQMGDFQDVDTFPIGICKCSEGWTNILGSPYLPCGIPKCDFKMSCDGVDPGSPPPTPNISFSPCLIPSICGEGGDCISQGLSFAYTCVCRNGYRNLLNLTSGVCFRDCQLGEGCQNLGLGINPRIEPLSPPAPIPLQNSEDQSGLSKAF
ncbi:hypothetical protein SELMODRAFT_415547 [Selaginella moellendorffii]|uniref:EGF-like domain-containing protein n=1 Tax=Selaginella moellendorffii TaxID=88036 RepID=D8RWG8_SELML|nr:hypothetical protein SELMODRAFT_415547 [Selaginella moellendorffii]